MITFKELYDKHPEWYDLPIVLNTGKGYYEWVGGSAMAYKTETCDGCDGYVDKNGLQGSCPYMERTGGVEGCTKMIPVLVFAGN